MFDKILHDNLDSRKIVFLSYKVQCVKFYNHVRIKQSTLATLFSCERDYGHHIAPQHLVNHYMVLKISFHNSKVVSHTLQENTVW